jgi:predicted RNA-binding Zn ribbon-like protein
MSWVWFTNAVPYRLMPRKGKPHPNETPETIKLLGGSLCLDFANSVDWTQACEPLDLASDALTQPGELGRWGRRVGLFGARPPAITPAELSAAHELRAALYAIFAAQDAGGRPARADLDLLARTHAEAADAGWLTEDGGYGARPIGDRAALLPNGRSWRLEWHRSEPRRVRFAVAADAMALLADPERVRRVHRCPGRDCGWLFLDTSGRRKWCAMDGCGSREKMRRLYRRQRALAQAPG